MLKDQWPHYIGLDDARELLARMGLAISLRQIKRAAEKDAHGKRKLPFFVDPIDGKLKIDRGDLVRAYRKLQIDAHKNLRE